MERKGWRYVDGSDAPQVGALLDPSYVWDGDEPTDEELPGTCAWDTRAACETYAQYSHGCGWLVEVSGEYAGSGSEPAEIILTDALVISAERW